MFLSSLNISAKVKYKYQWHSLSKYILVKMTQDDGSFLSACTMLGAELLGFHSCKAHNALHLNHVKKHRFICY